MAGPAPISPGIGGPVSACGGERKVDMVSRSVGKRIKPASKTHGLNRCANVGQNDYLSCSNKCRTFRRIACDALLRRVERGASNRGEIIDHVFYSLRVNAPL